jgi:flavin-dependent dehydrogenase
MFDVIIVGGGPAGSTTALLLARAGWTVALIEKKAFPRRKVCGEFISATNLPLLKELGIADFYFSHGGPSVEQVGLFAANSIITAPMPPIENSDEKWGRALGREHLDSLLLEQAKLANVYIWQPWSATQFQKHTDYFSCTLTQKEKTEEISGRILIMANGSWEKGPMLSPSSSLSNFNSQIYDHQASDFLGFKAHFTESSLAPNLMPLLVFPGGYGGMVHTDNNRVTLSCGIQRKTLSEIRKVYPGVIAGEAVLQHIVSSCLGVRNALESAQLQDQWLSVGPLRPGIRKVYHEAIFYVGNSAGEAHPIVAEGISMALQAAWLLADLLIRKQTQIRKKYDLDAIGREYTKHWHSHCALRIRVANLFTQVAIRPKAVAFLLPLFKRFPSLISYGAKLSGKVKSLKNVEKTNYIRV